jgi:hypothetical protein
VRGIEKTAAALAAATAVLTLSLNPGIAQNSSGAGQVLIPPSNVENPADVGNRAHTNVEVFVPEKPIAPKSMPPKATGSTPPAAGGSDAGRSR